MSDNDTGQVRFDFIKSGCFRVIHADGAIGSITPQYGHFAINFYSERFPIPQQVTHGTKQDGGIGEERKELRVSRNAIVREVEVSVILSTTTLKAFHQWLGDQIESMSSLQIPGSPSTETPSK